MSIADRKAKIAARLIATARQRGSGATTFARAVCFLRKNKPNTVLGGGERYSMPRPKKIVGIPDKMSAAIQGRRLLPFTLFDAALEGEALALVSVRRRTRVSVAPEVFCGKTHEKTIVGDSYSRRCTYRKIDHRGVYASALLVARSGDCAIWLCGEKIARIPAPARLRWGHDGNGAYLRSADGTEYHPSASDLRSRNFVALVRGHIADARKRRKIKLQNDKLFAEAAATTWVRWEHVRACGYCVAGTRAFAAQNGLADVADTNADRYRGVFGRRLLGLAARDGRVRRVLERAIAAEHMIAI